MTHAAGLHRNTAVAGDSSDNDQITRLLQRWSAGEEHAREELLPLVYDRLHRLAGRQFAGEAEGHTLQPTALVNEAFLKLEAGDVSWNDRRHFYALATQIMRRILVDHARGRRRQKRGGTRVRVTLSNADAATPAPDADVLDLDRALSDLEAQNPRVARALELTYFGGLDGKTAAGYLDVSVQTLERDLRFGRAWLKDRLSAA